MTKSDWNNPKLPHENIEVESIEYYSDGAEVEYEHDNSRRKRTN